MSFSPIQISTWRRIPRELTKETWSSFESRSSLPSRPTLGSE